MVKLGYCRGAGSAGTVPAMTITARVRNRRLVAQ